VAATLDSAAHLRYICAFCAAAAEAGEVWPWRVGPGTTSGFLNLVFQRLPEQVFPLAFWDLLSGTKWGLLLDFGF
jgi:hypothetical protein